MREISQKLALGENRYAIVWSWKSGMHVFGLYSSLHTANRICDRLNENKNLEMGPETTYEVVAIEGMA